MTGVLSLLLITGLVVAGIFRLTRPADRTPVQVTHQLNTAGQQWIEEVGVRLTSPSPLGKTELTRFFEPVTIGKHKSIKKVVGIHPEHDEQLDAEMVFVYEDADLDGHYENDLILYSSTDNGKTWEPHPNSVVDPERNTISLDSIAHFSLWTASPPPPSPGGVSASLQLWLKANEGAAFDGGNNLTGWDDQSGSPKPETVIGTPTYVPGDAVNFNPSVRFDNTTAATEYLDFAPFTPASFTKGHYFLIFKQGLFPTNQHMTGAVGFSADDQNFTWTDGHIYDSFGNNDQFAAVGTSPAQFNRDIFSMYDAKIRTAAPNFYNYFNGTPFSTRNVGPVSFGSLSVKVGVCNNANLGFLRGYNGYIPETLLYNTDLSEDDRKRVETYLAVKYGLTMSHNYLSSAGTPTTIYDVSSHGNNIAGIGRDDASDLDQRQSKSIHPGALVTMGLGTILADNAANPNAFPADMSFMLWGHNGGVNSWQGSETPASRLRLTREWKISETGTVGTVKVRVPDNSSALPNKLPKEAVTVFLLTDNDGDFSSGATETAMTLNGTDWEVNFNFTNGTYFTFATEPVPAPGCVAAGLKLWMKADADDISLSGGTTVAQWNDASGIGNHPTAVNSPGYLASSVNYNPSITFNGTNQRFDWTNFTSAFTAGEIFYLIKSNRASTDNNGFATWGNNHWQHYTWSNQNIYDAFGSTTRQNFVPAWNIEQPNIYNTRAKAGQWTAWNNGTQVFNQNSNAIQFGQAATNLGFGNLTYFSGEIPEVVLYDRELTTTEKQKVNTYLAVKYGQTLSHNYLTGSGAAIWTTGGGYDNNIAGIGRDDCQTLHQKQSRSINSGFQPAIGHGNTITSSNAANTAAIASDQSFMLWGSNNLAASYAVAYTPNSFSPSAGFFHMNRIWKVQETGTVGSVKVRVPSGSAEYLLIDTDGDANFSTGTPTEVQLVADGSGEVSANYNFSNGQYFTFGKAVTAPGCVPGGLMVWTKADAGISVADGTTVATWDNQANNAYPFSQSLTAQRPTYYNATPGKLLNFNPTVDFDGAGDFIWNNTPLMPSASAYTYLAVGTDEDPGTGFRKIFGAESVVDYFGLYKQGGAAGNNGWVPYAVGGSPDYGKMGKGTKYSANGGANGYWNGTNFTSNASTQSALPQIVGYASLNSAPADPWFTWVDGYKEDPGWSPLDDGVVFRSPFHQITAIGADVNSGGANFEHWKGRIPEFIVYDRQLTDPEMARVNTYLAIKYGITLGQGNGYVGVNGNNYNYVSGNGTVIWNTATNSGYGYNIAGIGRDDCQTLNQKESRSVIPGFQPVIGNASQLAATNAAHTGNFTSDGSFLVWGSDNGTATFGTPYAFSGMSHRITRVWKTQETGTVGTVKVGVLKSAFPGSATQIHLLVSGDQTFDNSDTKITMNLETVGGSEYYTATTDFTSTQHFTFGAFVTAPGCVPGGLMVWAKADAGISVADGSTIDTWNNLADNAYPFSQSIAGQRPTYYNTTTGKLLNFNPTVDFDGAGDFIWNNTPLMPSSSAYTYLAVGTDEDAGTGFRKIFGGEAAVDYFGLYKQGGAAGNNGWVPYAVGGSPDYGKMGKGTKYSANGGANGYWNGTNFTSNASTQSALPQIVGYASLNSAPADPWFTWLDGYKEDPGWSPIDDGLVFRNQFHQITAIGADVNSGGANFEHWKGRIPEFIVYDRQLTDPEMAQVNTYLAIKYGITLGQGNGYVGANGNNYNYVSGNGTVIWNTATNTGYGYNIAGIGRDDCQTLNQKESRSVIPGFQPVIGNAGQLAATNATHTGNFSADASFLVWGSDNGAATFGMAYPFSGMSHRITRVWKTQETGTVGMVKVGVLKSDFPGIATQIHLLVSGDQTFDNSDTKIAMTLESVGGVDYYTATTDFTSTQHFTFGAYLVTPGCVAANLLTWYKATTGVTGNPVSAWQDLVNGRNVIQNTAAHQPAFQSAAMNFNPALLFDGSNDHLEYTAGRFIAANASGTMFGAATNGIDGGLENLAVLGIDNPHMGVNATPGAGATAQEAFMWMNGSSPVYFYNPTKIVANRAEVYGYFWNGGGPDVGSGLRRNGTETLDPLSEATAVANSGYVDGLWTIGAYDGVEPWNGLIGEVILYDRNLAVWEKNKVETYLAIKYGSTLSHNYYAGDWNGTTGTTLWTTGGGYDNDIAGIGRDDCQALNQKQSRSANTGFQPVIGNAGQLAASNETHTGNFSADQSFLAWGSDNGSATFGTPYAFSGMTQRVTRIWKTQETGTVGTVKVGVLASEFPGSATQIHLLISSDATFDNSDTKVAMSLENVAGVDYYTATADFTSTQHFTFGAYITAPGCVAAGLMVWNRADAGISVADGGAVANWNNQAGLGYHFSQGTVAAQPKFYNTTTGELLNFNPTVDFDGAGDFLWNNTPLMPSASAYTYLAVGTDEDAGTGFRKIFGAEAAVDYFGLYKQGGATGNNGWVPYAVGGSPDYGKMGKGTKYSASGGANGYWNGTNYTSNASTQSALPQIAGYMSLNNATSDPFYTWVDGYKENPGWSPIADGLVFRNQFHQIVAIGADVNSGGANFEHWKGRIPEFIVYNRDLTDPEMAKVNTYLAIKYGITLGQGNGHVGVNGNNYNYVSGNGTVVWTAAGNTAFGYDIAGIGREDCQNLHQKQSQSVNGDDPLVIGRGAIYASNPANPYALDNDVSFLIWGNNNGSATTTTPLASNGACGTPGVADARLNRIWRVQQTSSVGTVKMNLALPFNINGAIYMLIGTDPTMATWDQAIPMTWNGSNGELTYNFPAGTTKYITFAGSTTLPANICTGDKVIRWWDQGWTPGAMSKNVVIGDQTFNFTVTDPNNVRYFPAAFPRLWWNFLWIARYDQQENSAMEFKTTMSKPAREVEFVVNDVDGWVWGKDKIEITGKLGGNNVNAKFTVSKLPPGFFQITHGGTASNPTNPFTGSIYWLDTWPWARVYVTFDRPVDEFTINYKKDNLFDSFKVFNDLLIGDITVRCTDPTPPEPVVDNVYMYKTAPLASMFVNDTFDYVLTLKNLDCANKTIDISDALPATLKWAGNSLNTTLAYASANSYGGTQNLSMDDVVVPPGTSKIYIGAYGNTPGIYDNQAEFTVTGSGNSYVSDDPGQSGWGNPTPVTIVAQPFPDASYTVAKTANAAMVPKGTDIEYTFTFNNTTGSPVTVDFQDYLSDSLTYVAGSLMNTLGGTVSAYGGEGVINIMGMTLPTGASSIKISVSTSGVDVSMGDNVVPNFAVVTPSNGSGFMPRRVMSNTLNVTVQSIVDTDGDGVGNAADLDDDNDGILDTTEEAACSPSSPTCDTDGDGIINTLDLDADNDGINDVREAGGTDANGNGIADGTPDAQGRPVPAGLAPPDTDSDGKQNPYDLDSDNDGISDLVESGNTGLADADNNGVADGPDTDSDGIQNSADNNGGAFGDASDPTPVNTDGTDNPDYTDVDSDNDGLKDITESGHSPLDTNNDGMVDSPTDPDGDGIANNGGLDTQPAIFGGLPAPDKDGDGITEINDLDDDNDGILDAVEDGVCSPASPNCDTDGDGIPNRLDLDSDNDGINDVREANGTDANNDGIADGTPDAQGRPVPAGLNPPDTDSDGKKNPYDLDSDNDGISDLIESGAPGLIDANNNGVVDGSDADADGIRDSADGNDVAFGDSADPLPVNTEGMDSPDYVDTDSDNDGLTDIAEIGKGALDGNNDGMVDSPSDPEGDGIANNLGLDTQPGGFGGLPAPDKDADGVADVNDLDDDNDGILDTVEDGICSPSSSNCDSDGDGVPNRLDLDSDNDGINDVREAAGTDSNNDGIADGTPDGQGRPVPGGLTPPDTDTDGKLNPYDLDSDNDGVSDLVESGAPGLADADNNGVVDGPDNDGDGIRNSADNSPTFGDASDPLPVNTDGTDNPDYTDVDSNNNGIKDIAENGHGPLDGNNDGMVDSPTDPDGDGIANNGGLDTQPAAFGGLPAPDKDGDGVTDASDLDDDNDGILDTTEDGVCSPSSPSCDTDGDGIPNRLDLDSDNDGINDVREAGGTDANGDGIADGTPDAQGRPVPAGLTPPDTDGDGKKNPYDLDSDNDGISDLVEGGAPGLVDADNNGVVDGPDADNDGIRDSADSNDAAFGDTTDPLPVNTDGTDTPDYTDVDSDNDGLKDIAETGHGPLDGNNDGMVDSPTDPDGDGIANNGGLDTQPAAFGGLPAPDGDGDGVADVNDLDDDNDGILDATEDGVCSPASSNCDTDGDGIPNRLDLDSDNDGINDVREAGGTDTNNNGIADGSPDAQGRPVPAGLTAPDTDGDGKTNPYDLDADNDGISDLIESGTPGLIDADDNGVVDGPDADGDGIRDSADGNDVAFGDTSDPLPVNTDGADTPDYTDVDSDNDGVKDIVEGGNSPLDTNNDGMVDSPTDPDGDGIANNGGLDTQPAAFGGLPAPDKDGDGVADANDLDDDNDGILDTVEEGVCSPSSPTCDTDGDGIPNRLDLDSDNDGINDVREAGGTDASGDGIADGTPDAQGRPVPAGLTPPDTDGDGKKNPYDLDSDNDGLSDLYESGAPGLADANNNGTVDGPDADGDGIPDSADGNDLVIGDAFDPLPVNTDATDNPDYTDTDSNNNGVKDIAENGHAALDGNNDGMVDSPTDPDGDGIANNGGLDMLPGGFGGLPAPDKDGDGVADTDDLDDDNDGILDTLEDGICSPASSSCDTDGDGIPNRLDLDSDNDGINDVREAGGTDAGGDGIADGTPDAQGRPVPGGLNPADTDGDGKKNPYDLDSDNDGISDLVESGIAGLTDADNNGVVDGPDADGDGIRDSADGDDVTYGDASDPLPVNTDGADTPDYTDVDSDNNGIKDIVETGNVALDGNNDGMVDSPTDPDGDGIANNGGLDTQPAAFGGLPAPDNDGDGVADVSDLDDDNDGILDTAENGICSPTSTGCDTDGDGIPNRLDLDSDNDGINDVREAGGTDANNNGIADGTPDAQGRPVPAGLTPPDTDGDGKKNPYDLDSDNDGISDLVESGTPGLTDTDNNGTVDGPDTDGDGIRDSADNNAIAFGDASDPLPVNTDGTDNPDYTDTDSDNDGLKDIAEIGKGALDSNNDGMVDSPTDPDGDGIANNLALDTQPAAFGGLPAPDKDGDGVADNNDLDDDNDGILDTVEDGVCSPASPSCDTDGDGIPNRLDLDSDNDGLNDVREAGGTDANGDGMADGTPDAQGRPVPAGLTAPDTDGDGKKNPYDLDSDNDGLSDLFESGTPGLVDANNNGVVDGPDADGDGIPDSADGNDVAFGDATDPLPANTDGADNPDYTDTDSDNDGLKDIAENGHGPLDGNNDGMVDSPTDPEGDGIANNGGLDTQPGGFGGLPAPDKDGDGVADGNDLDDDNDGILDTLEDGICSPSSSNCDSDGDGTPNRLDLDSDNDGLNDVREAGGTDSNGDGIADGTPDAQGRPVPAGLTPPDTDGDGKKNPYDLDSDNDGISDLVESGVPGLVDANNNGTVDGPDADGDGIQDSADGNDVAFGDATDPLPVNTDGTDNPDYTDTDSNNNGVKDITETGNGPLDGNNDGMVDGPTDPDGDGIANNGGLDTQPAAFGGLPAPDGDGDGVADVNDLDDDNDGILDSAEDGVCSPASPSCDTDGDGLPNRLDLDSDNDGLNDVREANGADANGDGMADGTPDAQGRPVPAGLTPPDTDGDGTKNPYDLDSDNDGISDLVESGAPGLTDADDNGTVDGPDADGDGIQDSADGNDVAFGDTSDPLPVNTDGSDNPDYTDTDSNNNGVKDITETGNGALDGNNDGMVDSPTDPDGDGIANNGGLDTQPAAFGGLPAPDGDGDGVADTSDLDDDNDGILDTVEDGACSPASTSCDSDADGIPNRLDLDSDNDGINDVREAGGTDANGDGMADGTPDAQGRPVPAGLTPPDTDADGKMNPYDLDSDNDGISDLVESGTPGLVDANNNGTVDGPDADGDGIQDSADGNDLAFGDASDPLPVNTDGLDNPDYTDTDSDNDGVKDIAEIGKGALDGNNDGMVDSPTDPDGDGIANNSGLDTQPGGFGGLPAPDKDGDGVADTNDLDDDNDGILDSVEDGICSPASPNCDTDGDGIANRLDLDSDNDGINDVREAGGTDTNNDGMADGTPDAQGRPVPAGLTPPDTDGDGKKNPYDLDSDNDGISDLVEGGAPGLVDANNNGTVDGPDADGDGIQDSADGNDVAFGDASDPLPVNSDGADSPDYTDPDSDNDGIKDIAEGGHGALDGNNDGMVDSPTDPDGDGIANNGGLDTQPATFGGLPAPDKDGDGVADANDLDDDNDGILDTVEDGICSPASPNCDTDGDGIANRLDLDSDNDGINDVREAGGTDANGDGMADGTPDAQGRPVPAGLTPPDTDGDGKKNPYDLDSDNDGISDLFESGTPGLMDADNNGTVDGPDADGDGIQDSADGNDLASGDAADPAPANTDGSDTPDYTDTDSDNDGVKDITETGNGALDGNNDGSVDSPTDPDGDGIANNGGLDTQPAAFGGLPAPDVDGDGVADANDLDDDNDGILDTVEDGICSPASTNCDSDGDGIPNRLDLDSDNDGINDVREAGGTDANGDGIADGTPDAQGRPVPAGLTPPDTDGDGKKNPYDLDSDNDGISDLFESGTPGLIDADNNGTVDGPDTDGDGIQDSADGNDLAFGDSSDPLPVNTDGTDSPDYTDTDSDNDGLKDITEGGNGALDGNNDGMVDSPTDPDGDGIANNGGLDTQPAAFGGLSTPDTDGDGVADANDLDDDNDGILDTLEDGICSPSSPNCDTDVDGIPNRLDLDSDNDGLNDVREAGGTDANGDGIADGTPDAQGRPVLAGLNPPDTDTDGKLNPYDLDSDNDGISDLVESGAPGLTDANNNGTVDGPDADGDGIQDSADGNDLAFGDAGDPAPANTDGTGNPDYTDTDSDNDGVKDIVEGGNGPLDNNNDGMVDSPTDPDGDGIANNGGLDTAPTGFGGLQAPDADNDGVADASDLDDDNDGILDAVEDGICSPSSSNCDTDGDGIPNRLDLDSDNDGINDVREAGGTDANNDGIADGTPDPQGRPVPVGLTPADTDGDGKKNPYDLDSDNDGISDLVESGTPGLVDANNNGTVDGPDADGDGIQDSADGTDVAFGDASDPLPTNTDGADNPDYTDTDSDNDTTFDIVEGGHGALDGNNDGMVDSPTDPDGDGIANNGGLDTQPAAFGGLAAPGAGVALTAKMYLGAVYNDGAGLMSDNLRSLNLIPLSQPYGGADYADFAYNGTELTTAPVLAVTGNNAIVDWVLVELHDAVTPVTVVARRAALLQRDGDVVDVDGVSPLTFSSASSGNYYVSVRHRNHIGVMTQNTVTMSPAAVTVDFTLAATGNYQLSGPTGTPHAQQVWGSTKRSLWAGNMANASTTGDRVIYQGANSDIEATYFKVLLEPGNTLFLSNYIVANVYARTDANMNGNVIYQGANADADVPFFTVSLYPANTLFLPNYVVFEQIPK